MQRMRWVEQRVVLHASVNPVTGDVKNFNSHGVDVKYFNANTPKITAKTLLRSTPITHNWVVVWLPKSETFAVIDLLSSIHKTANPTAVMVIPLSVIHVPTVEAGIMMVLTEHATT